MSGYQTISVETDDRGVAQLRLSRPEKHNAMSAEMIAELTDAAQSLGQDDRVRAVVLSGQGKTFCAGADLGWMKAQIEADRAGRMREARKLAEMLGALNAMPRALIGRIQGGAFGGGVGLACICDVAIAEQDSRFGFTETRLGLIPATIGPYVLARMDEGNARRVFMSARLFGAEEAMSLGVVAKSVPADDLDAAVAAEVEPYLGVAPGAVGRAKKLARMLGPRIDEAVIDSTIEQLADCWETEEAAEGIAAFLEKRPARWAKDNGK